ncbi:hypothetical protein QDW97_10230 [Escherichia coli]|nr:hypothetical protein [Escherichia coli]WHG33622.1 hypothetical protein QDW97_10230 [Escherichia coli]
MVLIKKNVLSASIATVLLGSTGAFAANDRGFTSDTDWSEENKRALMDMLVLHLNMRPKALITI